MLQKQRVRLAFPDSKLQKYSIFALTPSVLGFQVTHNFFIRLLFFPFFLLLSQEKSFVLVDSQSKNKVCFFNFISYFNNLLVYWCVHHRVRLKITGVGYQFLVPTLRTIIIVAGHSHAYQLDLPEGFGAHLHGRKKKVLVLWGPNWEYLFAFADGLRKLRLRDIYRGKGLRFFREKLRYKLGKKKFV